MMKNPFILVISFVFIFHFSHSENVVDELKGSLSSAITDSSEVQILLNIANEYAYTNLDSSIKYAEKGLLISVEIKNSYLEGLSRLHLGYSSIFKGEFDLAKAYHEKAIDIFQDLGALTDKARALNGLGLTHYHLADYRRSIQYYLIALDIVESTKDADGMGATYLNIASIYSVLGEFDKDLNYCKKAAETYKNLGNERQYAICLNNMADTYNRLGEPDKAIKLLTKSIRIKEKFEASNSTAYSYVTMYEAYEIKKQVNKGKPFLDKSFELFQETGSREGLIAVNQMLARYFESKQEYQEALDHALIAYLFAIESGMKREEMIIADELAGYYLALKREEKAFICQENHLRIKDSILGESVSNDVLTAQISFELKKKKELIDEAIEIQSIAESKLALSNKQTNYVSLSLISILASFQILGLIYYFRRKRLLKKE